MISKHLPICENSCYLCIYLFEFVKCSFFLCVYQMFNQFHHRISLYFFFYSIRIAKNVEKERKSNSKYAIQKNHYSHIIHPAFKKRSIDELTPLEKFDLNLHRNSRHALYKQINTFLKTYEPNFSTIFVVVVPFSFPFLCAVLISKTNKTKCKFRFFSEFFFSI